MALYGRRTSVARQAERREFPSVKCAANLHRSRCWLRSQNETPTGRPPALRPCGWQGQARSSGPGSRRAFGEIRFCNYFPANPNPRQTDIGPSRAPGADGAGKRHGKDPIQGGYISQWNDLWQRGGPQTKRYGGSVKGEFSGSDRHLLRGWLATRPSPEANAKVTRIYGSERAQSTQGRVG